VFPLSKRKAVAVAVGAAVIATGLTLAFGASSAGALPVAGQAKATVPGDNGDVKIHNSTTPVGDQRNEPHVCVFYLDAFNFDSVQSVSWWIEAWAPTGTKGTVVDSGVITLDSSGNGFTTDQTLPNGHYKLFWTFAGEKGAAKHKVFWVSCPGPTPPPTTMSPPPTTMSPPPTTMSPPPTTMTPPPTTMTPPSSSSPPASPTSPAPTTGSPSQTTPAPPPPAAPAPTPVQTTLPVTG
jgi:hypothetical protein